MIARELIVKLGFNIDVTKFDKFSSIADSIKAKMAILKDSAAAAILPEVKAKAQQLATYRAELQGLSKAERDDILALNKLEKQAIAEVKATEKQKYKELKAYEKDLMLQKRQSQQETIGFIKTIRNAARAAIIVSGGIAASFMLNLRNTLKDVKNFKSQSHSGEKTASTFDPVQVRVVDSFNNSLEGVKNIIAEIRNSFVIDLLPPITEVLGQFNEWLKVNKAIIKDKITTVIKTLGAALNGAAKTVSALVQAFGGLERILTIIKIALPLIGIYKFSHSLYSIWKNISLVTVGFESFVGAIKSFKLLTKLTSPITLITAALTGLLLILDDLYVFSKGGNSVIGDIVNSEGWKKFSGILDKTTGAIDRLLESLGLLERKQNIKLEAVTASGLKISQVTDSKSTRLLALNNGKQPQISKKLEENLARKQYIRNTVEALNWSIRFPVAPRSSVISSNPVINNSPNFNMTINVPTGTTQEQATSISDLVKRELEKHTRYDAEKTLAAIGAY